MPSNELSAVHPVSTSDAVPPGKHHVLGSHVAAVGPLQAGFQLPRDRRQVLGDPTVVQGRHPVGQRGRQVAVGVVFGQRFQGYRRGIAVLGSRGQVRTWQGWGLPVEDRQDFLRDRCLGLGGAGGGRGRLDVGVAAGNEQEQGNEAHGVSQGAAQASCAGPSMVAFRCDIDRMLRNFQRRSWARRQPYPPPASLSMSARPRRAERPPARARGRSVGIRP